MGKYKSQLHTLILSQKKAIRNVAKVSYLDHNNPLFVQYKCLKFVDIVKLKTLIIKLKITCYLSIYKKMFITIKEIH